MTDQYLRLGSAVVDRKQNAPMRVVGRDHRNAEDHPNVDDPLLRQLGVTPEDTVYDCVFLPTGDESMSSPSKPYAYPEGRLMRYPVEAALEDGARRVHTQILVEFLAALLEVDWRDELDDREVEPNVPLPQAVAEAVIGADVEAEVPTEVLLQEARELADVARTLPGGDDADE